MFKKAAKEEQRPGVSGALGRALCGQCWAECGSQGFCAGTGDEDQGLKEAEARDSEAEEREASGGDRRALGDRRHGVCTQTSRARPASRPKSDLPGGWGASPVAGSALTEGALSTYIRSFVLTADSGVGTVSPPAVGKQPFPRGHALVKGHSWGYAQQRGAWEKVGSAGWGCLESGPGERRGEMRTHVDAEVHG